MSLFLPERVPVTLYKWNDVGAPSLNNTTGCVANILKSCLVTGYGTKAAAGWSLAFEDVPANKKVLRAGASQDQDFYIRLSSDTGREINPQVYLDMTSVDAGNLKLQCATSFKYGAAVTTGNWMLIATARGFWFFAETSKFGSNPIETSGSYIYCGDTGNNTVGAKGIYLMHTGGSWGITDGNRSPIMTTLSNYGNSNGKIYIPATDTVLEVNPSSYFNGISNRTANPVASSLFVIAGDEIWGLPALLPSNVTKLNYDGVQVGGVSCVNHSTGASTPNNMYVPVDYWEL